MTLTDPLDVLTSLSEVFDALANGAAKALSADATHARQIGRAIKCLQRCEGHLAQDKTNATDKDMSLKSTMSEFGD